MKILSTLIIIAALFLSPAKNIYADNASQSMLEYTQDRTVLVYLSCEEKSKNGWGSGVIYEGNKVVTAEHVVDNVEGCDILVSREGEEQYQSAVISTNKDDDLAILIVAHDYGVTVSFAESKLGESVMVVGYPAQLMDRSKQYLSVLFGNISTKDINVSYANRKVDRISAPIYFGNSGGPVFNSAGQVVGIVSAGHMGVQGYFYTVRGYDIQQFLKEI